MGWNFNVRTTYSDPQSLGIELQNWPPPVTAQPYTDWSYKGVHLLHLHVNNILRCRHQLSHVLVALFLIIDLSFPDRYAYSDDVGEEFDWDESSLTLVKTSAMPWKDVRSATESRPVQANDNESNGDVEEDKTA